MARQMRILREAEISAKAPKYGTALVMFALAAGILTIPLIPFLYPLTRWYQRRYYAVLSVTLTSRELIVRRGVWQRSESTIPLEKVTDVGMVEGPIMRRYEVKGLRVETAGQTGAAGIGLVNIVGIVNPDEFRDAVLDQRDKVSDREEGRAGAAWASAPSSSEPAAPVGSGRETEMIALLREIRDHVSRIS